MLAVPVFEAALSVTITETSLGQLTINRSCNVKGVIIVTAYLWYPRVRCQALISGCRPHIICPLVRYQDELSTYWNAEALARASQSIILPTTYVIYNCKLHTAKMVAGLCRSTSLREQLCPKLSAKKVDMYHKLFVNSS